MAQLLCISVSRFPELMPPETFTTLDVERWRDNGHLSLDAEFY
jgi:hypothetical protein